MMDAYLTNVLEQPGQLDKVFTELLNKKMETVKSIARLLDVSGEIVLTSMGSAYNSLQPMYYALLKKKKKVTLIDTSELIQNPDLINSNAVYVVMSRSGESREVHDISFLLKRKNCMLVGITMSPNSTLAKNSTITLHDSSTYDKCICLKAYSSMALCGLMCVTMMGRQQFDKTKEDKICKMINWMDENKEKILHELGQCTVLKEADSCIFLSRSYGMSMAYAASLWLEEIAFISGTINSVDSFYHGPIRAIYNSPLTKNVIVPVYFDVLPDERSYRIWGEVVKYAKSSVYIGKGSTKADYNFNYPFWDIEEYNLIGLTLYAQLIPYQCCVKKGYIPGESLVIAKDRWVVT